MMKDERTEHGKGQYESAAAVLLLLGLFTLGFVAGTVIWNKGSSADGVVMIAGRADVFSACETFSGAFRSAVLPIIPFFLVIALCGCFVFGWVVAPLAIVFRAVGFGAAACALASDFAADGVGSALLIAPGAVVSLLLILEAVTAAVQSQRYFTGRSVRSGMFAGYLLKLLIYAVLMTAVAAVQAGVCVLM